jgi:hypothetical protein
MQQNGLPRHPRRRRDLNPRVGKHSLRCRAHRETWFSAQRACSCWVQPENIADPCRRPIGWPGLDEIKFSVSQIGGVWQRASLAQRDDRIEQRRCYQARRSHGKVRSDRIVALSGRMEQALAQHEGEQDRVKRQCADRGGSGEKDGEKDRQCADRGGSGRST